MMTVCQKCGYQRTQQDSAPEWQCPSCGIAYIKATATPPDIASSKRTAPTSASRRNFITHAGAITGGLIVGYFLGREHLKYQFADMLQETAKSISSAFTPATGRGSTKPTPEKPIWNNSTNTEPLRGLVTKTATLESEDEEATLVVRLHEKQGLEVYVRLNTINSVGGDYDTGLKYSYKFDDEPVEEKRGSRSTDYKSIFLNEPEFMYNKLLQSTSFTIEIPIKFRAPTQFVFQVAGLDRTHFRPQ